MIVGLVIVLAAALMAVKVILRSYSSWNIRDGLDRTAGTCGRSCS